MPDLPDLYFNTVEDGPLDLILRFLSATPSSPKWASNMPAREAEVLFEFPGALGDVFRARFTTVALRPRGEKKCARVESQSYVSLEDSAFSAFPDAWMARAAANIESLSIMDKPQAYFWANGHVKLHIFRFSRWVSIPIPKLTHSSIDGYETRPFQDGYGSQEEFSSRSQDLKVRVPPRAIVISSPDDDSISLVLKHTSVKAPPLCLAIGKPLLPYIMD